MMMSIFRAWSWCVQRIASIGLVAVVMLCYWALWHDRPHRSHPHHKQPSWKSEEFESQAGLVFTHRRPHRDEITAAQLIFVVYGLFVHVLGLIFPMRLGWSTWTLTRKLRYALSKPQKSLQRRCWKPEPWAERESESGYESDRSCFSEESNFSINLEGENRQLIHAIIVPNYKEDVDTLRETLDVLACHSQAREEYHVFLAMELAELGAATKASTLVNEYSKLFRRVEFTLHPCDIPGEAQGKSSNLAWAARHISSRHQGHGSKRNVLVTVLDADSHLSSNHFSMVSGMHLTYTDTAETTIYVPPIIFDRNAHKVPVLVRVADLLWCGAGLSCHYSGSTICPPTSVYTLPLALIDRVGGWDTGDEAIGEDLHMYLKCYFALNGSLTTRTVLSPASQTNVSPGMRGIRGCILGCKARYKQALRHMWGALDAGYVANNAPRILFVLKPTLPPQQRLSTLTLLCRIFEAHFLPTHLTILLIAGSLFTLSVPLHRAPLLLMRYIDLSGYIRGLSFAVFICAFVLLERYHQLCVTVRKAEMEHAGLAGRMRDEDAFTYRSLRHNWKDYVFFPIAGTAFGSVPAVVALLWHFWTTRLVYRVSAKPLGRGNGEGVGGAV